MTTIDQILQFKITLLDTKPIIWRRIQILENCTFWDLHVAIQSAMGWEDCHLHQFIVYSGENKRQTDRIFIGLPDNSGLEDTLSDWETAVINYLDTDGKRKIIYEYDFGDGWEHEIKFEGYFDKIITQKYPCCIDGALACPPEDVGGIGGYYDFLEAIKDKTHPAHEDCLNWIGSKYNPEKFDAKKVKFKNANMRLKYWKEEMGE